MSFSFRPLVSAVFGSACFLCLSTGALLATESAATLAPLSAAEASQIVHLEESAKQAAEAEQLERLDARPALDRSVLDLGDRKIFYNRTAPAVPRVRPQPARGADEFADSDDEAPDAPSKPQVFLMFSATVYEGGTTELRWEHHGRDYHAWSPINFNYLTGIGDFETAEANYHYFMSIGNEERAPDADPLAPTSPRRAADTPATVRPGGYMVRQAASTPSAAAISTRATADAASTESGEAAFALFDALHLHYRANEKDLKAAYQRRQTLDAAREAYRREHPPVPRDTVINFAPFVPAPGR